MEKTGSQVLDSICISEAEKQAVLTLIREEVHTFITHIQHEMCHVCLFFAQMDHVKVFFECTVLLTLVSLFRSSLKRWKPATGRKSTTAADKKSLR